MEKNPVKHYQSWIGLPRVWTSTLLKPCGIIVKDNEAKTSQHPTRTLNYLHEAWRTITEDYLKKLPVRISKRFHIVLKNKGDHTKY